MSGTAAPPNPILRPMRAEDIDAVIAIEEAAYPFPWTAGIFADCLRAGYACYVVQAGDEISGYFVFNWGAGEAHLLNLCVRPGAQGRGYGSLLLEHAIRMAGSRGCSVMFLEVRPSNLAAGALYRRRGFASVGKRRAYYPAQDGREDAVVMRLDL